VCLAGNVTTRSYDNFRTGWNWQETTLTPAVLQSGRFTQLASAWLDDQVDAQPLVLSNQNVNGTVFATVVYVATENNSVFAFDGSTGTMLAKVTLEPFVPSSSIGCGNNGQAIGINSTPVIDAAHGTLYVVTATPSGSYPAYHLHALDVSTLKDKTTPQLIAPSGVSLLTNRQRAALTLFNGGVLIPFTSFCDHNPGSTFGTLVYANMTATAAFVTTPTNLATIWMSGLARRFPAITSFFRLGTAVGPIPRWTSQHKSAGEPGAIVRVDRQSTQSDVLIRIPYT